MLPRRVVPTPRRDAPGADLHHMMYNHIGRRDTTVDAVCEHCGLQEVDITPTAMHKTCRFRWPGGELTINKPACPMGSASKKDANAKR